MTDDRYYAGHRPVCRRESTPGELLWRVHVKDVTWSAELRTHSEYGFEIQILRDGELVIGERFGQRDLAVYWADRQRERLQIP